MPDFKFSVDGESVFFEDLSKSQDRRRRIAGIISTETRDRQQEIVIQKGLNFDYFLQNGYFNDNHSKDTDGIIGWPETVEQFRKGQKLPNGDLAKSNCTWCEGYLWTGDGSTRADKIWSLSQALKKSGTPRSLGYSIEGSVTKRMGPQRKIVAEAMVTATAVTNCPVNTDTKLETLAKSLTVIAQIPDALERLEQIQKGLSMGSGSGQLSFAPVSGEGAGAILSPESLEKDPKNLIEKRKKRLSKAEAVAWVQSLLPNFRLDQAERLVDAAITLEAQGRL